MASPEVLWVGEFGGEYHYGIGFCTKRFGHLVDYIKELSKKHPGIFFEKAISVQISSTIFPRKYLSSKKPPVSHLTVGCDQEPIEIDELDERVLSGLTTAGGMSHRQLALKLQVPLSTLEVRIKKLREKGVITGDIFLVEPSYFGRQSFKLLVFTKGLYPQLTAEIHKFCAQHKDITYLINCLGNWGYEIGVEVRQGEEVTAVVQDLYEEFGSAFNPIKMLTKFRYPKVRWFPERL